MKKYGSIFKGNENINKYSRSNKCHNFVIKGNSIFFVIDSVSLLQNATVRISCGKKFFGKVFFSMKNENGKKNYYFQNLLEFSYKYFYLKIPKINCQESCKKTQGAKIFYKIN